MAEGIMVQVPTFRLAFLGSPGHAAIALCWFLFTAEATFEVWIQLLADHCLRTRWEARCCSPNVVLFSVDHQRAHVNMSCFRIPTVQVLMDTERTLLL